MQTIVRIWAVLVFGLGTLAASGWALDEVTFSAVVDKERCRVGESLQYMVEVRYPPGGMIPNITPPSFSQFSVQNEYQSIQESGTGETASRTLRKFWLLAPEEAGRLSIAAAIVTYQDPISNLLKSGKTPIQFVMVAEASEEASATTTPASAAPAGVRTWVWLIVGLMLAGTAAAWMLLRMAGSPARPAVRRLAPEAKALQGLQQALALAEADRLEDYFADLNRILQEFLQDKFFLDVHALSTADLLQGLRRHGLAEQSLRDVESFFRLADKARFAGHVPTEDELIEMHGTVKDVVEHSRPLRIKPPALKENPA